MNIFYQLIGFGALIAMGLSYWQNDKRTILLWQVVANLIFAIHYTLLHACSGALCSFFQIVVLLLFLLQEKFNWSKLVTAIPIVAVFLLIAVVTYETPVTVLPIVASLAALLPFFQSRRRVIQVAGIASGLSWLVYVVFDVAAVALEGTGPHRTRLVLREPAVQPLDQRHAAVLGQLHIAVALDVLVQLIQQGLLRLGIHMTEQRLAIFPVADDDAALPASVVTPSHHAVAGRSSFCH